MNVGIGGDGIEIIEIDVEDGVGVGGGEWELEEDVMCDKRGLWVNICECVRIDRCNDDG